ncbi:hypothetical protein CerSpe_115280 [Prunus speciosa]
MVEGTHIQNHLYEFNKIFMDLKAMDVKIDDEDQVLILLRSLPHSYGQFLETMLYGWHTMSMEDVKTSHKFHELKSRMSENSTEGRYEALNVQGKGKETCIPSRGLGKANATFFTRKGIRKLTEQNSKKHYKKTCLL